MSELWVFLVRVEESTPESLFHLTFRLTRCFFAQQRRKFANTVMVASANYGYLDFILNWICNTRAVGNYRPLLVAQDTSLHTHIMERQLPVASFLGSHINVSSFSRATNFYEGSGFAKVSMMKVIAARAILESGRDVFFSDVDVAFAKDPLPFFRGDVDFEVR